MEATLARDAEGLVRPPTVRSRAEELLAEKAGPAARSVPAPEGPIGTHPTRTHGRRGGALQVEASWLEGALAHDKLFEQVKQPLEPFGGPGVHLVEP
jgi:hypothetical protein